MNSRVSEATMELIEKRSIMKRDDNRNKRTPFLAEHIRRMLKKKLEDYKRRKLVVGLKGSREVLLYHHTVAMSKTWVGGHINDRTDMKKNVGNAI